MFNPIGRFFVIEGIDGSGKSTFARSLAEFIQAQGRPVLLTREPGATELGKVLRSLVQESKSSIDPYAELLLFTADRAQHMAQVVRPALGRGQIVITDRFKYSSLAYQGYGRDLDKSFIECINDKVTRDVQPDLVFYCKIDPQIAIARCINRNEKQTRFEAEGQLFMQKVSDGFDTIFENMPNVVTIDAHASQEKMLSQAIAILQKRSLL